MVTVLKRRVEKLGSFLSVARETSDIYNVSTTTAMTKVLEAFKKGRFMPTEALLNGILDPSMPWERASAFVSKRELVALQERVNPGHWYYMTEDKGIFYRFCEEAGIKIPIVHAVLFRGKQAWVRNGRALRSMPEIGLFLEEEIPSDFVIKPTRGAHGQSVWVISRSIDGEFTNSAGRKWERGEDLAREVMSDPLFSAFVVQDRVSSHPVLTQLTGSKALQSSRIVTYVDRSGRIHFVAASIRLIGGAATIDNIDWGRTGNFALQLHPESGLAMDAMTFAHNGRVMQWIRPEDHPKFGSVISNFRVPDWEQVVELVSLAARKLLPLRTLGWDVAITPDGPMIVEANFRWDPMMHPSMRKAVDTIRSDFDRG